MKNSKNIINSNCWVAYFDILGFTEQVKKYHNHPDTLARIYYHRLFEKIDSSDVYLEHVNVYWFSDSFIFYTNDDSPISFTNICPLAEKFITNAIWQRKPLRGALSYGRFYVDKRKNIFIGEALIEAHDYAEKQEWIGFLMTPEAIKKASNFKLSNITGDVLSAEYYVPVKNKDEEQNGMIPLKYSFEELRVFKLNAQLVKERVGEMYKSVKTYAPDYVVRKYINTLNFLNCNEL